MGVDLHQAVDRLRSDPRLRVGQEDDHRRDAGEFAQRGDGPQDGQTHVDVRIADELRQARKGLAIFRLAEIGRRLPANGGEGAVQAVRRPLRRRLNGKRGAGVESRQDQNEKRRAQNPRPE